jgi:geranylgeranyl pyrophosphate synthase
MPTLNARWSPPATVLTGDFLFARAAKLAAETDHLPLMKLFSETLATIVNGELTQMFTSRGLINRDNYYKRIYAKTASLFEMTARAAAMVSPSDEATIESMRVSDMRSAWHSRSWMTSSTSTANNRCRQTARLGPVNGLVTLPAIYYAEANPNDADVLSLPNGGWTNTEHMTRLVENIRASNAPKDAMREAEGHVDRALTCLESPRCLRRTRRAGKFGKIYRR